MQIMQLLFLVLAATLQTCHCVQPFANTFTDNEIFYDLSTYNFAKGSNEVYEYTLTARDTHQVMLYLFQNNVNQYSINVYDGLNDKAQEIGIQGNIPDNKNQLELPEPIITTGKNMFIRVQADTNLTLKVDFQAFATDYVKPADCHKMVMTMNMRDSTLARQQLTANARISCYYIIHANDATNDPLLTQYVDSNNNDINKFSIYKGLSFDNNHLLLQNSISTFASDKYLVIWPLETVNLLFRWNILDSLDMDLSVTPNVHGQIMTNNYFQDPYPNLRDLLEQTFTLRLPITMSSIQISYINFLGTGSLSVTAYLAGNVVYKNLFLPPLNNRNATYSCDLIQLKYVTAERNLGSGSGFYVLYDDATDYSPRPPTDATVEITTKYARNMFYVFTILLSLFIFVIHG